MRALKALLKVWLGLTLGLGLAELAFHVRDDGAFPHLNLYAADARLGVRLEPNTAMRLRVADNAVTTVSFIFYSMPIFFPRPGAWMKRPLPM